MSTSPNIPDEMAEIPIPESFFSRLLPSIDDLVELKLALYILYLVHQKRSSPRLVTYQELSNNEILTNIIQESGKSQDEVLRRVLESISEEGTLLHLSLNVGSGKEDLYFLNTTANRETITEVRSSETSPDEILRHGEPPAKDEGEPNIFTLYEQNIGLLTPMIAEELKEAEETYPASWIEDAFREAVSLNKRNWRYIARILERWGSEGKEYGASRRHHKKIDPDKYIKGKYGHMVRR